MHEETPKSNRYILTLKETEARLSLGMTSNKTYHLQTTANHHRFIKVWTSIADLPTSNFFVQTFFMEKVWLKNTLPTYSLDIRPNAHSFFILDPSLTHCPYDMVAQHPQCGHPSSPGWSTNSNVAQLVKAWHCKPAIHET